jgi:hypothetical protein
VALKTVQENFTHSRHFSTFRFFFLPLNSFSFFSRSSQQPGKHCIAGSGIGPGREEEKMNFILEFLHVLFDVIQDTGTGTKSQVPPMA